MLRISGRSHASGAIGNVELVTFRFNGLRKDTTNNVIETYFTQFGQRINYEIEFDSNGNRLPTFNVTTSSKRIIAWLSST